MILIILLLRNRLYIAALKINIDYEIKIGFGAISTNISDD